MPIIKINKDVKLIKKDGTNLMITLSIVFHSNKTETKSEWHLQKQKENIIYTRKI